jgi:hypothetical protein
VIKERRLFKQIEPYLLSPEAIVVTGMRRTGKTTLLRYFYERDPSGNKLFLDLENPVFRKYFEEENYDRIRFSFETMGLDFTKAARLYLDEIQYVRNLPSVVKYFVDHYGVKFFLTGSAGFYLKNVFSETLAGRKFLFELFPLSFREFLEFKDSPLRLPRLASELPRPLFETAASLYDEYLAYGGFPGVVLKAGAEEKNRALDEIFTSFYQQEVVGWGDFRKNEIVRDLILLLAQRTGSKLDFRKLSVELGVARTTLGKYLAFLEGTYLVKTVRPFAKRRDVELRKIPKVYFCDCGLAGRLAKVDDGCLFENSVFQNLRVRGEVKYYQRKNGPEIDFVLDGKAGYEVKLTPRDTEARKLEKTAREIGLESWTLVSKRRAPDVFPGPLTYAFLLE